MAASSSPSPKQPAGSTGAAGGSGAAGAGRMTDLGAWLLRVLWLLLPLTVGGIAGDALAGRSQAVRLVAEVLAWSAWTVALVATAIAHPAGLTVLRITAPAVVVGAVAAVVVARPSVPWAVAAVVSAVAAAVVATGAATADRCVDGASYGPERRLALRIPLPLLAGPLPAAWLLVTAGITTGPLLLAARNWPAGIAATLIGFAAAAAGARSIHGLSNRFVVLVPAGFVLHDRAALLDPVLFSRGVLDRLGPAEQGTDATDLTLGATGLVLEARLAEPIGIPLRTGRNDSSMTTVSAVLFSPVRPGRLLEAAAAHGLPCG